MSAYVYELGAAYHPSGDYKKRWQAARRSVALLQEYRTYVLVWAVRIVKMGVYLPGLHVSEDFILNMWRIQYHVFVIIIIIIIIYIYRIFR